MKARRAQQVESLDLKSRYLHTVPRVLSLDTYWRCKYWRDYWPWALCLTRAHMYVKCGESEIRKMLLYGYFRGGDSTAPTHQRGVPAAYVPAAYMSK